LGTDAWNSLLCARTREQVTQVLTFPHLMLNCVWWVIEPSASLSTRYCAMLARASVACSHSIIEWNKCLSSLFSVTYTHNSAFVPSTTHTTSYNVKNFHSTAVLLAASKPKPKPKPKIKTKTTTTLNKQHKQQSSSPKNAQPTPTKKIQPAPKPPKAQPGIQFIEGDSIIRYRPSPSLPPTRILQNSLW
jgi:hypothetical protein